MTLPRLGTAVGACLLALAAADVVRALPVVRKIPGGPWVTQAGSDFSVPAGQPIEWTVRVCNDTPSSIVAQLTDYLHSGECTGHEHQVLLCPPLTAGGGVVAACDDAASPPLVAPALDISGIGLGPNDCVDVIFATRVHLTTPPGALACNIAVYATTAGTPDASGQTSPVSGSGCSCVEVVAPVPTAMQLELRAEVESPPFSAGDSESAVVYRVDGSNETPRDAEGRFVLPIPVGLSFDAVVVCPPGATCGLAPSGDLEVAGLVVAEAGSFEAAFRLRGNCSGVNEGIACAQGWFEPLEDPGNRILTDDPSSPDDTPTCFKPALPDFVVTKTWRYEDRDGSGTATAGDRVRFLIRAWNRGVAPARDVQLRDPLPIGFDLSATGPQAVAISPGGTYETGRGTWEYPEMGPGTVVEEWIETTMSVDAAAPNRVQLTTRVLRDCGVMTFLSDDPLTPAPDDATSVGGPGLPLPVLTKTFDFEDDDGDGRPSAGETTRWRIQVRNEGPGILSAARLRDPLPPCLGDVTGVSILPPSGGTNVSTSRIVELASLGGAGGLAPDESVAVEFDAVIIDPAACCNQATLEWDATSVVSSDARSLGAAEATCLQAPGRMVRFAKSVSLLDGNGDGVPSAGDRLRYEIVITNDGIRIPDLILGDDIPANVTLDASSIIVNAPGPAAWDFVPPPGGLRSRGRLHVDPLDLDIGQEATVSFEVIIDPGFEGETCNRATLLAEDIVAPMLSEDVAGGGPTCILVVAPGAPILAVELAAFGELDEGCALPGEEVELTARALVGGGMAATGVSLTIGPWSGFSLVDPGGGVPSASSVTWPDVGDVLPGSEVSRTIRVQSSCDEGAPPPFVQANVTATNAAPASSLPLQWTPGRPDVQASFTFDHDDVSGEGVLDAGETILATLLLEESGSCAAASIAASLTLDGTLAVVELRDGASLAGDTVEWPLVDVPVGGSIALTVLLGPAPDPDPCTAAAVVPEASWPSDALACPQQETWSGGAVALPRHPCSPGGSDLLREDGVSDLRDALALLPSLLDADGDAESCLPSASTRVNPSRAIVLDVAALLDPGIVLLDEALGVGPGPGQLVFYEVSHSCDVLRACKVDADGDPSNGPESLRFGVRPCGT